MRQDLVLIKLGGSVVTHKERAMTLNKRATDRIIKSLLNVKKNTYHIPTYSIILGKKQLPKKIFELAHMTEDKIVPVTYGDIVYITRHKYSILSGDELMTLISTVLRPKKVIFAINVDGIYEDPQTKNVIHTIDEKSLIKFSDVKLDITGGMKRKVREASKISLAGIDVHFVNGFKPERLLKIIENRETEGTVIKG